MLDEASCKQDCETYKPWFYTVISFMIIDEKFTDKNIVAKSELLMKKTELLM